MRLLRKTHPYRSPIWNHITHTFTTCPLIPGVSKKALAKLSRLESTYESTMERMKGVSEDNSLLREAQNTLIRSASEIALREIVQYEMVFRCAGDWVWETEKPLDVNASGTYGRRTSQHSSFPFGYDNTRVWNGSAKMTVSNGYECYVRVMKITNTNR